MTHMRRFIAPALAALALAIPSTAGAAIVHAEGSAGGGSPLKRLSWVLDYDSTSKDVTLNVTHTLFGTATTVPDPTAAGIVLVQPNGVERSVDLLALRVSAGNIVDTLNAGPVVINLPAGLRVSADRAALIEFRTEYTP